MLTNLRYEGIACSLDILVTISPWRSVMPLACVAPAQMRFHKPAKRLGIIMAIYHLNARIIGRSAGRSVIAAAAWQNACRLWDDRLGRIANFTGKRRVAFSTIMIPYGVPSDYNQREYLWNTVEAREKRKDAQLARQFDIALPDELSTTECVDVIRRYAKEAFVESGYAADVTVITLNREGGHERRHGYILVSTRPFELDTLGAKDRSWNLRSKLVELRERWATILNDGLARGGHAVRVDHRSNEARQLGREPGEHVGVIATQMERRGLRPDRQGQR